VRRLEDLIGTRISGIGVGPDREQQIPLHDLLWPTGSIPRDGVADGLLPQVATSVRRPGALADPLPTGV